MRLITLTAPCYECGEKSVIEGLCAECYRRTHPLVEVRTPLKLLACRRCGAVKVPGGWKTIVEQSSDPEALIERQIEILLEQEVKLHVGDVQLEYSEEKILDRVRHILVTASGKSDSSISAHSESYPVEVRFSYATCDTCAMMSGGYYEGTLQIRADERQITDKEEDEIVSVVTDLTVAKYGKDVKAFVTEVSRNRYGLDFKIGSEHLCKRIADELEERYLAQRKENYKLIGEDKGGKKKYRITILIRLQRFTLGDFVKVDSKPCQVTAMGRGGLTCYNLTDGNKFTINRKSAKWRTIEFISPESDKRQFMVVSNLSNQPVQLMDSESFEMHEIDQKDMTVDVNGDTAFGLYLGDRVYLLPSDE
ncbi:MAG: 60S ribosomal export protein NMD3 [Candidatus Thorarchaeota archaeon]|jgi:nonsense-mediated mRNA decay protein 3